MFMQVKPGNSHVHGVAPTHRLAVAEIRELTPAGLLSWASRNPVTPSAPFAPLQRRTGAASAHKVRVSMGPFESG